MHAPKLVAGIENEVVALGVSPGAGDAEAEAAGFGEECGFGGFAIGFARGEADGVKLRDVCDRKGLLKKKAQPEGCASDFVLSNFRIANSKRKHATLGRNISYGESVSWQKFGDVGGLTRTFPKREFLGGGRPRSARIARHPKHRRVTPVIGAGYRRHIPDVLHFLS